MGFHELARVIPVIREHFYYSNASTIKPEMAETFEGGVKAAHWVPEDVFQRLNAVSLYDGHVKVYPSEAAAVADLGRAWKELANPEAVVQ
jgi:hypothetical protein